MIVASRFPEGYPRELETARLLLSLGADIDAETDHGQSVLYWASEWWRRGLGPFERRMAREIMCELRREARPREGEVPLLSRDAGLMTVACWGNPGDIKSVLERGADVNVQSTNGYTPLMFASVYNRDSASVQCLLDAGAEVDAKNVHGETALAMAVQIEGNDVIRTLVNAGANVKASDAEGCTFLMNLVYREGPEDLVRLFIDLGAEVNAGDEEGGAELMRAAACDRTGDMVRLFIDAGAKVGARNKAGETALMHAASSSNGEAVRALLASGASLEETDNKGYAALAYLASYEWGDDQELVQLLIDAGADVNAQSKSGESVLMCAAGTDGLKSKTILTLLAAGANIEARDNDGRTALRIAFDLWRTESLTACFINTAKVLFDAGADPCVLLPEGDAAPANRYRGRHSIRFHLDNEGLASLPLLGELIDEYRASSPGAALMDAAYGGSVEDVQAALVGGVDIDVRSRGGTTPLMFASRYNTEEVVQFLLDSGADPNARNGDGETPLSLVFNGNSSADSLRALVAAGAVRAPTAKN